MLCEGIYSYFSSSFGTKTPVPIRKRCHPPHNRSLKEVERRKREAKKELRSAKRSGSPADVVPSLARHFFSLVRVHSQLKRAAKAWSLSRDIRAARERCHKRFKGVAREVLDGGSDQLAPSFSNEVATSYFSDAYRLSPWNFFRPGWLPVPISPEVELDCSPFTQAEVAQVIKRTKAQSSPSPFDRVGYIIFKKCPSLFPVLVQLFNICWSQSTIPGSGNVQLSSSSPKAQLLRMTQTLLTSGQLL